MTLKEFMELLGMSIVPNEDGEEPKGWLRATGDPNEVFNLKVDGPYVDEWANMICSVQIPDGLWEFLNENH